VRAQPANVPPLHFTYDKVMWERSANRLPARPMSIAKQQDLSVIIDELLQLSVIIKSQATSWSQVVLVKKPNGKGWRLTIDYRNLNKVITNQG
jgi:hypothetical protein